MEAEPEYQYQIASKGKRLLAHILEGVIRLIVVLIYYVIMDDSIDDYLNREVNVAEFLYSALIAIITGFVFYPLFSGNLGHRLLGLKVISVKTGEEYKHASDGAIRELLKYLGGFLIIPVVWLLWDKENQNLYDKITETYVVEKWTLKSK